MCENYELVKSDKNSILFKEYFSSVVRNLDTKKCNIGSAPAVYSIDDLTLGTTCDYKGQGPFNFSNADETDIINKILSLKKELQKTFFSVKSK